MKLSVKGMAIAAGVWWAGGILIVGVANLMYPSYGGAFLNVLASIYSGYQPGSAGDLAVGVGYGLVDGAIGGGLFAWLYNFSAGLSESE